MTTGELRRNLILLGKPGGTVTYDGEAGGTGSVWLWHCNFTRMHKVVISFWPNGGQDPTGPPTNRRWLVEEGTRARALQVFMQLVKARPGLFGLKN